MLSFRFVLQLLLANRFIICNFVTRLQVTVYLVFGVVTQILTQKTIQHVRENAVTRFRPLLGPHGVS